VTFSADEVYAAAVALAEAARNGEAEAFLEGGYGDLRGAEGLRAAANLLFATSREGDEAPAELVVGAAALGDLERRFRRHDALAALYEAEQLDRAPNPALLTAPAAGLAAGVWESRAELDAAIGEAATGWRVDRMTVVDRNVLRIGLYELRQQPGTPEAVVISEAVRLAKAYSTEHSGRFVNGVLGRLAAEIRGEG
jgi:N utilization substance protein B